MFMQKVKICVLGGNDMHPVWEGQSGWRYWLKKRKEKDEN